MTIRHETHWKPVKKNKVKRQGPARAAEISVNTMTNWSSAMIGYEVNDCRL